MVSEADAVEVLSSHLSIPINFRQLQNNGFIFNDEPFFRSLLISIYRCSIGPELLEQFTSLRDFKLRQSIEVSDYQQMHKSKLVLPSSLGRTMYGVFDETGLLQYGQVFVQYSSNIRNPSSSPIIHKGPVLVTKNPCHVAGDIRLFEAVYQNSLKHLRDMIVFPRYGPRPYPDEMAAMIFPKFIPVEYQESPNTEDLVYFFLKYLRQDSLGKISNAHLIMADRIIGPFSLKNHKISSSIKYIKLIQNYSEICDNIAKKCSVAVDFPKTGRPATRLTAQEQSDLVPDYMQNSFNASYPSRRLLSKLYRFDNFDLSLI
ncbi:unnamed protein product [Dracunculus medinensis]|uniref:RNA-dependent RNA polymerase n=1 Tax=Dracunculus medinensis TaxID=318479 RepID=A0A3P7PVB1_DRAME|nr:unnamed protein product [Dracunculus medinensis]